ncbi:MAG TPA: helix-turn-helix domain-containing protein [Armatimonadota bacterium]|nr:helix-turn-helix domain-containing protein [Armatimonadota bacterium]
MKTYTPEQAAEVLQVTVGTVRKLARDGRLQGAKIGRHWRFSERDIERFLEDARPKSAKGISYL